MKQTNAWVYKLPWIVMIAAAITVSFIIIGRQDPAVNHPQVNVLQAPGPVQAPLPRKVPANIAPQAVSPSTPQAALQVQAGISQAVAMVRPSIVAILSPRDAVAANTGPPGLSDIHPFQGKDGPLGSGVIITTNGYVLTTFERVVQRKEVQVKVFSRHHEYTADVVTIDQTTDLALLKIRGNETFPAAILGNSDFVGTGDLVFAVGNPFGFGRSVSMGIISSNRRQLQIDGVVYPHLLQTDAAINDGDAGGPLINIRGEVIGIAMAYYIPDNHFSGIGFAIPINDAKRLLNL
jgi:S1-C subfamily serine protease